MSRVTINLDNELESKIKQIANSLNISTSEYISNLIKSSIQNSWDPSVKKLAGSWEDFPTLEEIRDSSIDAKREEL